MKKGIIGIIGTVIGATAGAFAVNQVSEKKVGLRDEKIDKFMGYYNILNQWLLIKQQGKSIDKFFEDNGYKTIAIYGMGEMGKRLYDELKDSSIVEVKYGIDKNAASTYSELDVRELEGSLETVDAIVVTATFAFDEVKEQLTDNIDADIISLEDVVFEL